MPGPDAGPRDAGRPPVDAGPPDAGCADLDGDGVDSCSDCDDTDPHRAPGLTEVCDGKDNDCDGTVDELVCSCTAPAACGVDGACQQQCTDGGVLGACLPPDAGSVELQNDPSNCGQCGLACPAPAHADARCAQSACGRGPCEAGFFDLDGPATFGCEATCAGRDCTLGDGGTVHVNNDPMPERSGVFHSLSAGASFADKVQTNPGFTNVGVVGQGVPLENGAAANGQYRHVGGFGAAVK